MKLAIGNAPAINFGTLTADSVQLFVPKVTTTNTTASSYYTVAVNDGEKANAITLQANEQGLVASTEFKTAIETRFLFPWVATPMSSCSNHGISRRRSATDCPIKRRSNESRTCRIGR